MFIVCTGIKVLICWMACCCFLDEFRVNCCFVVGFKIIFVAAVLLDVVQL